MGEIKYYKKLFTNLYQRCLLYCRYKFQFTAAVDTNGISVVHGLVHWEIGIFPVGIYTHIYLQVLGSDQHILLILNYTIRGKLVFFFFLTFWSANLWNEFPWCIVFIKQNADNAILNNTLCVKSSYGVRVYFLFYIA